MVAYPQRITLCGFGGQGIILSAVILGTTAVTKGDLYAVQTQSYGSEARGGQCQAELIIDKKAINSPVAEKKNLLVACINRNGRILTPRGKDTIEVGDTVIIVTTNTGLKDLKDILA